FSNIIFSQGTIANFCKKFDQNCCGAQGTIEYLVLLAVILVIALLGVFLINGMNNGDVVNDSADKLNRINAGLVGIEGVVDENGDGLVYFKNNTSKNVTVTGVGNNNYSYSLPNGENVVFSVSDLNNYGCVCNGTETKKVCVIPTSYEDDAGIPRTYNVEVELTCVSVVELFDGVIEPNGDEPELNDVEDLSLTFSSATVVDFNDVNLVFVISNYDANTGCWVKVDNDENISVSCSLGNYLFQDQAVGDHNYYVLAKNDSLNLSERKSVTISLNDISGPVISSINPVNDHIIYSLDSNIDFNFIVTDDSQISSCSLYLDNVLVDSNSNGIISGSVVYFDANLLTAGDHVWDVNCIDSQGNVGTMDDRNIIYDVGLGITNISTCLQLQNINNNLDWNYILTQNIDCSDTINWNDGNGFIPIGLDTNGFNGVFDGQNYSINNLFIKQNINRIGLFSVTDVNAILKDFDLIDSNIYCTSGCADSGLIFGHNHGDINNVYSSGKMTLFASIDYDWSVNSGGFGGINYGSISYSGNLIDFNIFNPGATSANRPWQDGGFLGRNYGEVFRSYSKGRIIRFRDGDTSTGGFVGYNTGTINECYADVNITAQRRVGGFVAMSGSGQITNCFSKGNLYGLWKHDGGFFAHSYGNTILTNNYSSGNVPNSGGGGQGGFGGWGYDPAYASIATNNYYRKDVAAGINSSSYVYAFYQGWVTSGNPPLTRPGIDHAGFTNDQMRNSSNFVGFDFTDVWAIDSGKNNGFPYLKHVPID
ncbi:MAG: hypothetical protein PHQ98_03480, partial [Candidatus ainarchaeum sp.]|nr:hypothetical protein [Candidatus ainarchaeum sp.]